MAIVPIYTGLALFDFSLLPLLLINHFCLLCTPFQSCPLPYWLFGLYYTWVCQVFFLSSTSHPMTNSYPFNSTFKKIWRVKLYFSKELLVIIFTSYGKIHNFKKKNCPGLFDPQPLMVLITIYLVRLLFRNVLVQCLFFLTLAFYFVALAMNESSPSYRLLDWAGNWKTEWVKPS